MDVVFSKSLGRPYEKLSLSFRLLRKLGLLHSEELYGNISLFGLIRLVLGEILKRLAFKYAYSGILFEKTNYKWLRAWLWRKMGVHVGKNVNIYQRVSLDFGNAHRIFIEDDVAIANGSTLLCHMRKFEDYYVGDSSKALPKIYSEIHLKKGCSIGMNATIMPGVTVGEGAIVGACSFVTRDVPPWTVVVGNPARLIRQLPQREGAEEANTSASK